MDLDHVKEAIKSRAISEIIGLYLPTQKKGPQTYARCPWHNDTNPSLTISDAKGLYRCFVCDIGGDAIHFAQTYLKIDFIEAMKDLGSKLGFSEEELNPKSKTNPKRDLALKLLSRTAYLYQKAAQSTSADVFHDFVQSRGLDTEMVKTFMLGHAPSRDLLVNYLQSLDEKIKKDVWPLALEIGLIRAGSTGHYDTFNQRIIFPLWDRFGRIVGFSSRATREEQKAKYLNSQESFIFHKRDILYGLHLAKNDISEKDRVFLVEGQMDCIALHQFGFKESVAVSGVAIGDRILQYLTTLTKNIYLLMDNDQAGQRAQERLTESCLRHGILPKRMDLGALKDPDDFLRQQGVMAFRECIEKAQDVLDTLLENLVTKARGKSLEFKLQKLNDACQILSPLGEHLIAKEKLIGFAKDLGLKSQESDIVQVYTDHLKGQKSKMIPIDKTHEVKDQEEATSSLPPAKSDDRPPSVAESQVLTFLITCPEAFKQDILPETLENILHPEVKRTIVLIKEVYLKSGEIGLLEAVKDLMEKSDLSTNLRGCLGRGLFDRDLDESPSDLQQRKTFRDLTLRLKIHHLKNKRDQLKMRHQTELTQAEATEVMQEIDLIQRKLHQLNTDTKKRMTELT